jgi:hypothetical protein
VLLHAGVCLKVPFNRVTVKKSKEPAEAHEMVDFAGVSGAHLLLFCLDLLIVAGSIG